MAIGGIGAHLRPCILGKAPILRMESPIGPRPREEQMTFIISFGSARRKVVFWEGMSLLEMLSQLEA